MIIFLTGPTCAGKSTLVGKKIYNRHILVIEIDLVYKKVKSIDKLGDELSGIILASHSDKKHIIVVGTQLMLPGVLSSIVNTLHKNDINRFVLLVYIKPALRNIQYLFKRIKQKKSNRIIIEKIILFLASRIIALYTPVTFYLLAKKYNNQIKIKKLK